MAFAHETRADQRNAQRRHVNLDALEKQIPTFAGTHDQDNNKPISVMPIGILLGGESLLVLMTASTFLGRLAGGRGHEQR
jgi:hypothetical protein